jgi:hypothetical protein
MMFWDIRNFRYNTAQALADNISIAFGIDRLTKNYEANKLRLEQLINIHSARMNDYENKNINKLLLLLAMLQVIPTLYNISQLIIDGTLKFREIKSAIASVAICFILWLIFKINLSLQKRKRNIN